MVAEALGRMRWRGGRRALRLPLTPSSFLPQGTRREKAENGNQRRVRRKESAPRRGPLPR